MLIRSFELIIYARLRINEVQIAQMSTPEKLVDVHQHTKYNAWNTEDLAKKIFSFHSGPHRS